MGGVSKRLTTTDQIDSRLSRYDQVGGAKSSVRVKWRRTSVWLISCFVYTVTAKKTNLWRGLAWIRPRETCRKVPI